MYKLTALTITFLLSTFFFYATAQQSNSALPGTAKGIVRDTAQNYVLKSATVSVYKAADSTLLSYQVTNNYGEFNFKNLPVNTPLRLDISHVGYMTIRKSFSIPSEKNSIDLKTIVANRRDITLADVVISVPPITMNGDTLEFNAAAFKLDSNAVVEDLLRSIPNIVLWGDGKITVNGKEVKNLLVNGKSFFGGDPKIATQNIAKNALQKIQVYSTAKNERNPQDSTLEMNLKLKKGKDIGFFGKIGAGYGTNNRFETDASINMFTPKMQLALVGAMNNVNKVPDDVGALMSSSTFKGVGTDVEYQPDFRASGINRPATAGLNFTYNFVEKPTYDKKNTLKSNYFIRDKNSDFLSKTKTTTSVNSSDKVIENSNTVNSYLNTDQRFDTQYELITKGHELNFSQSVNINNGSNTEQTKRTAGNLQDTLTSTNNSLNTSNFKNSNFNLHGGYRYSPYFRRQGQRFIGFTINYDLAVYNNENERKNITEFTSFENAASNQKFNRKYNTNSEGNNHRFEFVLPGIQNLIFGSKNVVGLNFDITNNLNLKTDKNDNQVQDLDTLTGNYNGNAYLSNRIETSTTEEIAGLRIEKSFNKSLSNRYHKSLTIRFHPKQILMSQDNKSDRAFQNIKRNYHKFVPDGGISYNNSQYGEYSRYLDLNYFTRVNIPNINQLAPLTDSTNLYYLQRGNINLKEAIQQEISFSFSHYDQKNKNTLHYSFNISAGMIKDNVVDSLLIDDQNRRTVYLVNADGNKYINFYGNIRKAYKLKSSEFQFNLNGSVNFNKNPGYTNNVFTFSSNFNTNSSANINYTYKSYLAVVLGQTYSTYLSKQEAFNTKYSGKNLGTNLSTSYNLTKKLTLNSNVSFNNSSSSNTKDINFTIWNASAIYRFLKGNNAEFKFSALDLLHQNSSVINYGNSNSFTIGTQNVLKQYFMTTIAYYPRQFGKKAKAGK